MIDSMHSQCHTPMWKHTIMETKSTMLYVDRRSKLRLQNSLKTWVVSPWPWSSFSTIFIVYQGTYWTLFKIQNKPKQNKTENKKVVSVCTVWQMCDLHYWSFNHPDRCPIGGHPRCALHVCTSGFLSKGKQWLEMQMCICSSTSPALEILFVISAPFDLTNRATKKEKKKKGKNPPHNCIGEKDFFFFFIRLG